MLICLSVFGLQRLVYTRSSIIVSRERRPQKNPDGMSLPKVCVQLPLYNEEEVAERIITATSKLDYPQNLLEIQVLDDSDSQYAERVKLEVERLRNDGLRIRHLRRDERRGFKAGALAEGLKQTDAEFLAIFDADFVPPPDFLTTLLPYFENPGIGMIQARWTHLNRRHSLLTRAQAALLDGHFQIEHTVRNRSGVFFNFNGTAGVWRKSAIENAGGWQGDTLTEDLDLSYRAQLEGSQFIYLLESGVPAELPVTVPAFKQQQHRWTKGAVEVLRKLGPEILQADISSRHKLEAMLHLGSALCYPILLLGGLLVLPSLFAFEATAPDLNSGAWTSLQLLLRAVFALSFLSVAFFYYTALRESVSQSRLRNLGDLCMALSAGAALSLSNSVAVCEAVCGKRSAFMRTPKTGSTDSGSCSKAKNADSEHRLKLLEPCRGSQAKLGNLFWIEALLAVYFFTTAAVAVSLEKYFALPFCCIFFAGFAGFTLMQIRQRNEMEAFQPKVEYSAKRQTALIETPLINKQQIAKRG